MSYNVDELKQSAGKNGAKKREAVYDKGEVVKSSASYVPKVISLLAPTQSIFCTTAIVFNMPYAYFTV